MRHVDEVAPCAPVGPAGDLPRERVAAVGVGVARLLEPAEAVEVAAEPPRRDAVERLEEDPEPLVHRVHEPQLAVPRGPAGGGDVLGDPERGEDARVGGVVVGRDPGAVDDPGERGAELRVGRPAAAADGGELVAEVVGGADHAHLLPRDAAGADGPAVPVRPPRHPGPRPLPVPRERLAEVGAVDLARHRRPAPEGLQRRAHHLEEAHAHEPRGPEADAAPPRELPEGLASERPLRVVRPGRGRQLGHRDHGAGPRGERC